MKPSGDKRRLRAKRRIERALADSAELLTDIISGVDLHARNSEFWVFELGRLLQDRLPSFEDREFRLLIEQGVRLDVSPNVVVRAKLVERLRSVSPELGLSARGAARSVIGALEDVNFPLEKVGIIVRSYTKQLFQLLENTPDTTAAQTTATEWIAKWRQGVIGEPELIRGVVELGADAVPAVADALFESVEDTKLVDVALEMLSSLRSPLAARVLAHLISEPILEEHQEARAQSILREFWPLPRTYIYYKLRQHSHEDIPFRWLELLIDMDDTRGVDRILEEVVAHGRVEEYREDLRAVLRLLDRSKDPGVIGKLLRLITEESLSKESIGLLEEWMEASPLAHTLESALDGWKDGALFLVPETEDFNSFAGTHPDKSAEELRARWDDAYHESLGWLQRKQLPRGPVESEFDRQLDEAMIEQLSLNPGLEESCLRNQIESFREEWLVTPQDNVVPLIAICLERRRDTPWLEEIHWNAMNLWYIKAAEQLDAGNRSKARQYLDIVLAVEPDYPLARMLARLINE